LNITLKLFATLGEYLPEQARANVVDIEVSEGATPYDVIDRFNVPRTMVHLVLLNGVYLDAGQRSERGMQPGDALAIWPPVAGG
jgi:molybdopterin converting factor small subunit